jgi:hypothetical protein
MRPLAPAVWQPTDAERARQAEARQRVLNESIANRRFEDANQELEELLDEYTANLIQRLQFSNDPPLREAAVEGAARIEGAAFTEGVGERRELAGRVPSQEPYATTQINVNGFFLPMDHDIMHIPETDRQFRDELSEFLPPAGDDLIEDNVSAEGFGPAGLEASEEELNRQAEGLAAAMNRMQGLGYEGFRPAGLEASEQELNRRAEGLAAAMHRVQGVGYDLYKKMENIIVDQLMVMRQELHQDKDYNGCFAILDIAAVARTMRMGAAMPNTQEMRALCEEINTPVTRDMLEAPTNLQRVLEKFLKRMERRDLKPKELERLKTWLEKCNENRLRQLLTLLLRYQIVQKDRVYSDRVFALVSLICEINPDLAHFYNVGLDVFQQRASGENVLRQLLMHTVAQTILQTENPAIDMQQYDDDTMQELALRLQFASIDILTGRIQTQIRIVFTIVVRYCICTMIRQDVDVFARSLDILRRYSAGLTEDENLDIFQYCAQLGIPIDEPE